MSSKRTVPPGTPPDSGRQYWRKRLGSAGHSLRVVVPQPICAALQLGRLSEVNVYLVGKTMCVEAAGDTGFKPTIHGDDFQDDSAGGEA